LTFTYIYTYIYVYCFQLEKKTAEVAEYRQRVELLQSSSGDREKQISTLERKLSERQSAHEAVMLELANLKAIVDASKSDNEIMKLRLEESQRTAKENEERPEKETRCCLYVKPKAQFEIKTSDAKIETLEAEIKNLRNQLDAQHGIDEQVDALHKN
uniref:Uncharacterized protein n=1 Tax=Parascaris equorum TaxID=6256 RepID=A0A914RPZ8_PAREQ